jgi:Helix-turn-helix domain of transposase family ISL3
MHLELAPGGRVHAPELQERRLRRGFQKHRQLETMHDFTELYGLRVRRVRYPRRGRFALIVDATSCGEPLRRCCQCGGPFRRHGRKVTTFRDLPKREGSVGIVVDRARFQCAQCKTTSLQPVEQMDHRHRMTERLVEYICVQALRRPFTAIASLCGIDEKTVRRLVRERLPSLTRRSRGTLERDGPECDDQHGDRRSHRSDQATR